MPQQAGLLRVIIAAASVGGFLAGFLSDLRGNHLLSCQKKVHVRIKQELFIFCQIVWQFL